MAQHSPQGRTMLVIAGVLLLAALLGASAGCSPKPPATSSPSSRLASRPASTTLTSPEASVRSYLAWTSWAYTMADSDLATQTMTPAEEVRVDSYVQLNREKGRVIDQRLTSFEPGEVTIEATRALASARETWEYRYVAGDGKRVLTPVYVAHYETTYTVVAVSPGRWLVERVDARALDGLK